MFLRARLGILYTVVVFGCVGIIGFVYSLEDLMAAKAIPLMLMVMPVLGSLSLVLPQVKLMPYPCRAACRKATFI